MLPTEAHPAGVESNNYTQFWQQIARNQIVNTIFPQTYHWSRHIRILRRQRFTLPASSSTDLDRNPEAVDFKWFIRDSRILRFQENQSVFTTDVAVDSARWLQNYKASTTNRPLPRSRLFLIIRATDMSPTITGDDSDDTPSFDMCIRRKTRVFPPIGDT